MPDRDLPLLERTKRRLSRFIHRPVVELGVVVLILLSVAVLLAELASPVPSAQRRLLRSIGDVITWIFVAELAIRFWIAPVKRRFFVRYWTDILAVLPLARPLRLLRVLLLLRLFRAGVLLNRRLSLWGGLFRGTLNEFAFVATLSVTILLVAATVVHLSGDSVQLESAGLGGSIWFSLFTMVAGEPLLGVPADPLGRVVALSLMLGGLTVFGVFVGTVSASMVTLLSRRMEVRMLQLDELVDHVVICGWNHAGPALLQELMAHDPNQDIVIITEQEQMPELPEEGIRHERVNHLSGDYTLIDVLERAGIGRASSAVLLSDALTSRSDADQDARTVLAALTIEKTVEDIFCCCQINSPQHIELLRRHGVEEVIVGDWFTGVILGSVGRNRGLLGVLSDILTTRDGNAFHKVRLSRAHDGKQLEAMASWLRAEHRAILVSVERAGAPSLVNPPPDFQLQTGDVVVLICEKPPRL